MDKGELSKIAVLFGKWWDYVLSAVKFPFNILDEEHCSERILNLIAYQRDVERFEGEPLELLNAKDAGSKAGFIRIFERLGIGYVEIEERFDRENWDVIKIRISDSQLAKKTELLNLIIRKYGRTCRRYTFEVITKETVSIYHGEFNHDHQSFYVKVNG